MAETPEVYREKTRQKIDALSPEERQCYEEAVMGANAICFECPAIFLRHVIELRCEATHVDTKCPYASKAS